jgi:hypothetical protein
MVDHLKPDGVIRVMHSSQLTKSSEKFYLDLERPADGRPGIEE